MDAPRTCYRHPDRETGLSCSECDRPICYECMTPAAVGLRCPEHSGKPQGIKKVTAPAQRRVTGIGARRINAITIGLIAANVFVAAVELGSGRSTSFTNNWIFEHGALFASGVFTAGGPLMGVAHGEWWRLFTSMFLHVNFFHLAVNMYSLYFAGTILEQLVGWWRFLLLYLVAGLAGAAGALVYSPNVPTVGASGAIFGILGALFVLERTGEISTGGQITALIVLNLVITFVFSSFISVGGHVGGLLGGIALMWLLLRFRRSSAMSLAAGTALAVLAVAIAYSKMRGYSG
jgi:membrane associated rhomboid family serine protease